MCAQLGLRPGEFTANEIEESTSASSNREAFSEHIEYRRGKYVNLLYVSPNATDKEWRDAAHDVQRDEKVKVCFCTRILSKEHAAYIFPTPRIGGDNSWNCENFNDGVGSAYYDHHYGKNRASQKSMCEMVSADLWNGQNLGWAKNPFMHVTHLDPDNVNAIAHIVEAPQYVSSEDPAVQDLMRFAWLVGRMDAMAGLYSHQPSDSILLKAWSAPISKARRKYGWLLDRSTADQKLELLEDMIGNTKKLVDGTLPTKGLSLETEYAKEKQNGWWFILEQGVDARQAIAKDLHLDPIISYRGLYNRDRHLYSFANFSHDPKKRAAFDPPRLCALLNKLEALDERFRDLPMKEKIRRVKRPGSPSTNIWGGDVAGGSFNGGSDLIPIEVIEAVNADIEAHQSTMTVNSIHKGITQNKRLLAAGFEGR